MCGPGCAYVVEEPSPPPMGSVHRGEEWYVEAIRSLLYPHFLLNGNPKGNGRKRRLLLLTTKLAKFSVRKTDTFMSQMPTLGVARLRKTLPPSQLGLLGRKERCSPQGRVCIAQLHVPQDLSTRSNH